MLSPLNLPLTLLAAFFSQLSLDLGLILFDLTSSLYLSLTNAHKHASSEFSTLFVSTDHLTFFDHRRDDRFWVENIFGIGQNILNIIGT